MDPGFVEAFLKTIDCYVMGWIVRNAQARTKMTMTGMSERRLLELKDTPIVALLSAEYTPRCRAAVR